MDKESYFDLIRQHLEANGFTVDNKREIKYGIQFEIALGQQKGTFRIYEGKKGIRLDSSQIRQDDLRAIVDSIINNPVGENIGKESKTFKDPNRIIGIDESGKGDYFGPLVIAGVYTDEITGPELQYAGVTDSKKISDVKSHDLAILIREICPYDIVIIENERYNDLYESIKNLNKLLAWGHARVLENLLEKVDCDHALSDQFGRPELIQKALMTKGRQIQLEQRPKAEENIAVAAASILARDEFVSGINRLESKFGFSFPKGASSNVVKAAKDFAEQFGKESMNQVAKLHFKITNQI
ncbi:MAG: ribonuclease HIII [Clostridiales bacterium]|jgi:ribonuclease HIII|nr:ribonuclease HIII [Clostridiales bacterium]